MVRLYTDIKYSNNDIKWIIYNDATFNSNITAVKLDKKDLELMKNIENLTLIDRDNSIFKSNSGVINISQISTGIKTLLNIRFLKRKKETKYGVDVTECGPNILEYVFNEVSDGSIPILLRHWDVLNLTDRYIIVNEDVKVRKMSKLYEIL